MTTQLLGPDLWRVMHARPKGEWRSLVSAHGPAALAALEALHAGGVVHRDVKPGERGGRGWWMVGHGKGKRATTRRTPRRSLLSSLSVSPPADNFCTNLDTAPSGGPGLFLIDFGGSVLAPTAVDRGSSDGSGSGASATPPHAAPPPPFFGTPHYAAHATLADTVTPVPAHDVESLGLVLLELWGGGLPGGAAFKSAVDAKAWSTSDRAAMASAREADFAAAIEAGAVPWWLVEWVGAARAAAATRGGRVSYRLLRSLLRTGMGGAAEKRAGRRTAEE